jgi:pentatricopeptide repeat protein
MSTSPRIQRPFPTAAAAVVSHDKHDNDNDDDALAHLEERQRMRRATMTLLDETAFPPGELLYDAWMDAQDEILPYWLNNNSMNNHHHTGDQQHYNNKSDDNTDGIDTNTSMDMAVESVDMIFQVLTRLAQEQTAFPTLTRCQWINVELLNRVVHHWFVIHQQQEKARTMPSTTSSSSSSSSLSSLLQTHYRPKQVLQLVEHYCQAFPQASWSTEMAYYFIVAELRPHESRDAVFCEALLQKTLQQFQWELEQEDKVINETYDCRPTARLFQAVLSAWTHVAVRHSKAPGTTTSTATATSSSSRFNDWKIVDKNNNIDGSSSSTSSSASSASATIVLEAAQKVDALLQVMQQLKIPPTPQHAVFVTAMHAWSRTNSLRGALRVEQLLEEMHQFVVHNSSSSSSRRDIDDDDRDLQPLVHENYHNNNDISRGRRGNHATTPWPWTDAFTCAIRAWAWSSDGRAGKQVEKLLVKFQEYHDAGIIVLDPINNGSDDVSRDHDDDDDDDMHDEHDHHFDMASSNNNNDVVGVYNAALLCYALLGTPRAARQAQALFWQITNGHDPFAASKVSSSTSTSSTAAGGGGGVGNLLKFVQPNAETYYWVTAAMANGGFVAESEAIASDLVARYTQAAAAAATSQQHGKNSLSTKKEVIRPLREMFHAIIIGWSRSPDPNRVQRARAIIRAMENRLHHDKYDDGDIDEEQYSSHDDDRYLCPNTATYNAYLSCLSKAHGPGSIQSAQEAVSVLEKMRFLSTLSLQGGGRRRRPGRNDLRPDCQTYSHVIHCLANCGRFKMAEQYFQEMIADYKDGNEAAKPNTVAVNMVLLAYSRSGDPQTPDRAEAWFRKFLLSSDTEQQHQLDLQPDLYSFTTFLNCLSKRRRYRQPLSETAQAVEDVFREMQQRYGNSSRGVSANSLRPNQVLYNIVINCWAQARNPVRAEQIFEEMYQDFTQFNNPDAEPNVRSLNSVMKAWAISGRTDSAERSEKILELMRDLHVNGILTDIQPTCVTYTTLLMNYALQPTTPADGAATTQRADAILKEMWKLFNANLLDEAPNEVTYKNLLQIWEKSNESNKADRIRAIHEEMRMVLGKERRVMKRLPSDQ